MSNRITSPANALFVADSQRSATWRLAAATLMSTAVFAGSILAVAPAPASADSIDISDLPIDRRPVIQRPYVGTGGSPALDPGHLR
jgi:hypothetical protein